MPILRATPVDDLYDRVADYDLVLTPDAPLASAIERRIDQAHFGTFATTPRRLAAGRREGAEDRTAFLEIVDRTDHDWKSLSYAVGNVLQCWEHQGSCDAILEYDGFDDAVTRDVVEVLNELKTTSRDLENYTVEADSVAVVGEGQFTELERSILPDEYDAVPLFDERPFEFPEFHVFDSPADIVDAIQDTVDAETANDVAVVLDSGSRYSPLIESALETADVPFYGGPGFTDRPELRAFVALCRTAFRGEGATVGDVRPILTQLGVDVSIDHENKQLSALDDSETEWLRTFCADLDSETFASALERFEGRVDARLEPLHTELEALGLADRSVSETRFDDLAFYLQAYDVPVDRENDGVLLADAKSAGYVDRPVVFQLGLDESWTHSAPRRPWVNTEAQFDRYLRQFQLLLQSGAEQYYLVQDTAGGRPVTPCLYLGELLDAEFERFGDLPTVEHTRPPAEGAPKFRREPVDADPEPPETISNSSLKTYVNSPRDYQFGRLLDGPDQDYFTEGTLFHDFAEYYVEHPGHVDADIIDEVAEVILEEVAPFVTESDRPLRRRKYRIGLETIVEYLDEHAPESDDFLTGSSGWGRNFFAEYFDRPVDSPLTERWFENHSLGVKGMIDLVASPDHLLDYKSGYKKSSRDVVRNAATDEPADTPDFQAALYLCHWRDERPDEQLQFTFFHFLETLDDLVRGDHDLEDCLTTVQYYPWTFDEHVGSRAAYDELHGTWNDITEVLEDLGFERYTEICSELTFPEITDSEELRNSEFADVFAAAVNGATSDDVDAEKGADQAVRLLHGIRSNAFFREDLDALEGYVQDQFEALKRYHAGEERFPLEGPGGEPNYRWVDNRDLLLEGSR